MRIPDLTSTEKSFEKDTSTAFEPLESFKMYKLQGMAWNYKVPLLNLGLGNLHVIFFYKEVDLPKSVSVKNGQEGQYKISFKIGKEKLVEELAKKNSNGYCCIFKENFFSINGNPFYPLPLFSLFRNSNECVLSIPTDRIERFVLIFDLIYSLFKSSTENKTILIASYLVVLLQDANMLREKFHNGGLSFRKFSAEILTDKFRKLISRYYLRERLVSRYAEMLFITPNHLNKIVKSTTGRTASELIVEEVLAHAKVLLLQSNLNVSEIAYNLGFEDTSYFTRLFKKKTGITPFRYRTRL
jgi:AraC family transcriptional regulator, transcriptional activator of pobA